MSRLNTQSIYLGMVAAFIGCNLWPFIGEWCYYPFATAHNLFIAAVVVNLSKGNIHLNRAAWINFLICVLDGVKEARTYLHFIQFDPTSFQSYEYYATFVIIVACFIGYRGLFILILYCTLNFTIPNKNRLKCLMN